MPVSARAKARMGKEVERPHRVTAMAHMVRPTAITFKG